MRYLCGPLRVVGARATRTLAEVAGETLAATFLETAAGAPITVTAHRGRVEVRSDRRNR